MTFEQLKERCAIGDNAAISVYRKRFNSRDIDIVGLLEQSPFILEKRSRAIIKLNLQEGDNYLQIHTREEKWVDADGEQSKPALCIIIPLTENLPENFKFDLANGDAAIECKRFSIKYKNLDPQFRGSSLNSKKVFDSLGGVDFKFHLPFNNSGNIHSAIFCNSAAALKISYEKTDTL